MFGSLTVATYNETSFRHCKVSLARMANIFVCLFAVTLCLINAVIWAFMSQMLFVGLGWVGGAAFCLFLQKWSRY